jgi:surface protein
MFQNAAAFNGDITKWNVEKVTDMTSMSKPVVERPTTSKTNWTSPVNPRMAQSTPNQSIALKLIDLSRWGPAIT